VDNSKEHLVTTTRKRKPSVTSPIQSISLPSVKLFWLNLEELNGRLTEAARKLAGQHSEIGEVWLFGSLARGQAVPGSDADVLLFLKKCDLLFLEPAVHYQPEFGGVGVDLFAYTRKELEQMEEAGHQFLERVKEERVCLFKRQKM
jgi:predicted nucleotidyltransferase